MAAAQASAAGVAAAGGFPAVVPALLEFAPRAVGGLNPLLLDCGVLHVCMCCHAAHYPACHNSCLAQDFGLLGGAHASVANRIAAEAAALDRAIRTSEAAGGIPTGQFNLLAVPFRQAACRAACMRSSRA